MTDHKGLPIKGYTDQPADKVALVNRFKEMEERLLREIDALTGSRMTYVGKDGRHYTEASEASPLANDPRWLAIARTHIQEGFMALNRAIFQPSRIKLPEDGE